MPTVNLRRYSDPGTLMEFAPHILIALMDEHREFLVSKGVTLPRNGDGNELDYEHLAMVFLSPDWQAPLKLSHEL